MFGCERCNGYLLLDDRGLMTALALDFRLFVIAKCGLAEYTGAEVKVNPKSHFAQSLDEKLSANPSTLSTSP